MNISKAEQRENLTKLATYLESLPLDYPSFEMLYFYEGQPWGDAAEAQLNYAKNNGGVDKNSCGTVACAVGHGPAAGILFGADEFIACKFAYAPDWNQYSARFADLETEEWDWMFCDGWAWLDNTHRGAAARIRYHLAGKPIPEDFFKSRADGVTQMELYKEFLV